MLVLSRKIGENIVIDDGIVLTVVDINRGKVRLGFKAPPNVKIYRKELLDQRVPPDEENVPKTA